VGHSLKVMADAEAKSRLRATPSSAPLQYILTKVPQDQFLNTFLLFRQVFRYFERKEVLFVGEVQKERFNFIRKLLDEIAQKLEYRPSYAPMLNFWRNQLEAQEKNLP
jgi:hypothetical protein